MGCCLVPSEFGFLWKEDKRAKMKYVLVTGGVVSGLGKGVTASSIGLLLKACGLRVTSIKIGILLSLGFSGAFLDFFFSIGFLISCIFLCFYHFVLFF